MKEDYYTITRYAKESDDDFMLRVALEIQRMVSKITGFYVSLDFGYATITFESK